MWFDSGPEVFVCLNQNYVLTDFVLKENDCILRNLEGRPASVWNRNIANSLPGIWTLNSWLVCPMLYYLSFQNRYATSPSVQLFCLDHFYSSTQLRMCPRHAKTFTAAIVHCTFIPVVFEHTKNNPKARPGYWATFSSSLVLYYLSGFHVLSHFLNDAGGVSKCRAASVTYRPFTRRPDFRRPRAHPR